MRGILITLAGAVWLAVPNPAVAQSATIDPLIERAKAEMLADPEAALRIAITAEKQAAALPPSREAAIALATALWLQSEASIRTGDETAAAPRVARALRLISGITEPIKLKGDLLVARAGVQQAQLRPAEALASLQEAFKIYGAVGEKRSQSITLQSIATLYTQANDFTSADKYFKQASEVYGGDPRLSLFLLNNRGNVLLRLERSAEAVAQYQRALTIARGLNSPPVLPPILINLARALIDDKKFDRADTALAEAGPLIATGAAASSRPKLLSIAAELAFERGDTARAQSLIEQSFAGVDLAKSALPFRDAHLTAYNIYRAVGQQARALVHLERVRLLGDEAAQLATQTNVALMAARFDYANQELRIANLKAEELRRVAEAQRTLFIGLGGATVVIIALLSFGLITIRRSRNQVRDANVVLNDTNVALEKALRAKTEFLATTSHEIRTPLNGILGMTQVMLRDPTVPAETRDRIGIVHGAGMTMRALVDDILDVAKMETGNLTVEMAPTDLHATLRDVTRMWDEQARAKGIGFVLDLAEAPRWIETDSGRLRQIVFNLLSNAIKFTETGSVAVRVAAAGAVNARRVCIAVADTGIGIPTGKHDEIFESFRQVDAGTTRRFGGTGLGLTIVRNLAQALGGDVRVDSVEGVGTTFTVDLPLREVAALEGMAPVSGDGHGGIVVLDRNPIVRGMLRALLEPKFDAVSFAATMDEALAAAAMPGVRWMLVDEVTLKAGAENAIAALGDLVTRARDAEVSIATLWARPDGETLAALKTSSVALVIAKPIGGAAMIDALLGLVQQNAQHRSPSPLVSAAA